MKFRKVVNSLTFRYIAKYLAVLTISVFALHAALFSYFSYNYFDGLGESIVDEIETLQLIYEGQSLTGVNTYLEDQYRMPASNRFSYLLLDERGEKLAGDLEVFHSYEEFRDGWLGFDLTMLRWGESVDVDFLARRADLGDEYRVMVARDYAHATEQSQLVFRTLVRVMVATLILGLIGGFFTASSALGRVELLSQELSKISRGDPRERLDLIPESGYVRELYVLVNSILDQMESQPSIYMEADSMALIKEMVIGGLGIAFQTFIGVEPDIKKGNIVFKMLSDMEIQLDRFVVLLSGSRILPPPARIFVEHANPILNKYLSQRF